MLTRTGPVWVCQPDVQPALAVLLTWNTSTASFVRSFVGSVFELIVFTNWPSARVVAVDAPAGPAGVASATPLPPTPARATVARAETVSRRRPKRVRAAIDGSVEASDV